MPEPANFKSQKNIDRLAEVLVRHLENPKNCKAIAGFAMMHGNAAIGLRSARSAAHNLLHIICHERTMTTLPKLFNSYVRPLQSQRKAAPGKATVSATVRRDMPHHVLHEFRDNDAVRNELLEPLQRVLRSLPLEVIYFGNLSVYWAVKTEADVSDQVMLIYAVPCIDVANKLLHLLPALEDMSVKLRAEVNSPNMTANITRLDHLFSLYAPRVGGLMPKDNILIVEYKAPGTLDFGRWKHAMIVETAGDEYQRCATRYPQLSIEMMDDSVRPWLGQNLHYAKKHDTMRTMTTDGLEFLPVYWERPDDDPMTAPPSPAASETSDNEVEIDTPSTPNPDPEAGDPAQHPYRAISYSLHRKKGDRERHLADSAKQVESKPEDAIPVHLAMLHQLVDGLRLKGIYVIPPE